MSRSTTTPDAPQQSIYTAMFKELSTTFERLNSNARASTPLISEEQFQEMLRRELLSSPQQAACSRDTQQPFTSTQTSRSNKTKQQPNTPRTRAVEQSPKGVKIMTVGTQGAIMASFKVNDKSAGWYVSKPRKNSRKDLNLNLTKRASPLSHRQAPHRFTIPIKALLH